jgi:hypothetical protein
MGRPIGVTIIGVLMAIGGVIMIGVGIIASVGTLVLPFVAMEPGQELGGFSTAMFGGIAAVTGAIMLALGIAALVIAYGLFKGRPWAWTAAVILSAIGIALSILQIAAGVFTGDFSGIISLIINGVIIYYLYRPHVKAYFGKAVSPPDAAAA